MDDEVAFLSAIRAAPTNTLPRLVYADWLEERGDGRSEFVRLHLQLAATLDRLQHLRAGLDSAWVETVEVRRDVVLHGFAPERLREVTKLVRLHTAYGLEQARSALTRMPAVIFSDIPLERAERLRQEFAAVATVTIEQPVRAVPDSPSPNFQTDS